MGFIWNLQNTAETQKKIFLLYVKETAVGSPEPVWPASWSLGLWVLLSRKTDILALLAEACGPLHGLTGES